jgi:prepilin-type N-terminal cleavage/methylation domain-containing protein/prepilin-type processing-associated H-X9-DG protein
MNAVERVKTPGRGFTMVELLVVIAIIGTLVALLVGGLGGALNLAQNVECQNNLRQIAAAVVNYATDYKGAIPPTKYTGQSGMYWCSFLVRGNYLTADNSAKLLETAASPRNNVLRCPAENALMVKVDQSITKPAVFRTGSEDYAQGIARLGNSSFSVDCSYYWNGYDGNSGDAPDYWTTRFPSVVVNPSATPSVKALLIHDISEIRQRTLTAMVMDGVYFNAREDNKRGRIAARHPGDKGSHAGTNMAFYDGHVEAVERTPGTNNDYVDDVIQTADFEKMGGGFIFLLPKR